MDIGHSTSSTLLGTGFPGLFSPEEASVYETVLNLFLDRGIRFAVGGGLAFSHYSQRRRNTKDIDLYVLPRDRDAAVSVLDATGFGDYYDRLPYDRTWIYRGFRGGLIVDIIWSFANHRADIDEQWLARGPVMPGGLHLLPVEELIWAKLYVMQRERCDWPDLLSILYRQVRRLDWDRLLRRVQPDLQLMGAFLALFTWLCPEESAAIPDHVWPRLGLHRPVPGAGAGTRPARVALLDSRDWFGPDEQAGLAG